MLFGRSSRTPAAMSVSAFFQVCFHVDVFFFLVKTSVHG